MCRLIGTREDEIMSRIQRPREPVQSGSALGSDSSPGRWRSSAAPQGLAVNTESDRADKTRSELLRRCHSSGILTCDRLPQETKATFVNLHAGPFAFAYTPAEWGGPTLHSAESLLWHSRHDTRGMYVRRFGAPLLSENRDRLARGVSKV